MSVCMRLHAILIATTFFCFQSHGIDPEDAISLEQNGDRPQLIRAIKRGEQESLQTMGGNQKRLSLSTNLPLTQSSEYIGTDPPFTEKFKNIFVGKSIGKIKTNPRCVQFHNINWGRGLSIKDFFQSPKGQLKEISFLVTCPKLCDFKELAVYAPHLTTLKLASTLVDGALLGFLRGLKGLESLSLQQTTIITSLKPSQVWEAIPQHLKKLYVVGAYTTPTENAMDRLPINLRELLASNTNFPNLKRFYLTEHIRQLLDCAAGEDLLAHLFLATPPGYHQDEAIKNLTDLTGTMIQGLFTQAPYLEKFFFSICWDVQPLHEYTPLSSYLRPREERSFRTMQFTLRWNGHSKRLDLGLPPQIFPLVQGQKYKSRYYPNPVEEPLPIELSGMHFVPSKRLIEPPQEAAQAKELSTWIMSQFPGINEVRLDKGEKRLGDVFFQKCLTHLAQFVTVSFIPQEPPPEEPYLRICNVVQLLAKGAIQLKDNLQPGQTQLPGLVSFLKSIYQNPDELIDYVLVHHPHLLFTQKEIEYSCQKNGICLEENVGKEKALLLDFPGLTPSPLPWQILSILEVQERAKSYIHQMLGENGKESTPCAP